MIATQTTVEMDAPEWNRGFCESCLSTDAWVTPIEDVDHCGRCYDKEITKQ